MNPLPFSMLADWPAPYDEAAADRLVERFQAIGEAETRLLERPGALAMLRCLGGNSPYLAELTLREHETARDFVTDGPQAAFAAVLSRLGRVFPAAKRPDIAAALRQAKRSAALIGAIADVGGLWPLETVTGA